jgi:hypothetical protein
MMWKRTLAGSAILLVFSCTGNPTGPDGRLLDPMNITGDYAITLMPDASLPGAHCPGPDAMIYSKPSLIECFGARGVNQYSANGDTMWFRRPLSATEPYAFWHFAKLSDSILIAHYSGDCQGLPGSGGLDNCKREFGVAQFRKMPNYTP